MDQEFSFEMDGRIEGYIKEDGEGKIAEECDRWLLELIITQYRQELLMVSDIAAKVSEVIILLATQRAQPIPYHTSILSGQGWVEELLNGHPERIRTELAVHKHVFQALLNELRGGGLPTRRRSLLKNSSLFSSIHV